MISPDQFFTKPLFEYYPANSGEWFAVGAALLHGGDPQYPHFMVKMLSGVNGEDGKMTRGELLCIIRIMERLLGAVKFIRHLVTPVRCVICLLKVATNIELGFGFIVHGAPSGSSPPGALQWT